MVKSIIIWSWKESGKNEVSKWEYKYMDWETLGAVREEKEKESKVRRVRKKERMIEGMKREKYSE